MGGPRLDPDERPALTGTYHLSKAEVDGLFAEWKAAGAKVVLEPEDKPWKLREFTVADPDGNLIRVFYDFRLDL